MSPNNIRFTKLRYLLCLIPAVCLFPATPGPCASIQEHFSLLRDAERFMWTDLDGNSVALGDVPGQTVRISPGSKLPLFVAQRAAQNESLLTSDFLATSVLDMQVVKTSGLEPAGVRAIWENRLPVAKHVQAELMYDVLSGPDGEVPEGVVALLIQLPDEESGTGWRTVSIVQPELLEDPFSKNVSAVREAPNERYRTYNFTANISEWAGKYVRLVLEARFRGQAGVYRARWLKARLVSSTFTYAFGEIVEVMVKPGQFKVLKANDVRGREAEPRKGRPLVLWQRSTDVGNGMTLVARGAGVVLSHIPASWDAGITRPKKRRGRYACPMFTRLDPRGRRGLWGGLFPSCPRPACVRAGSTAG